MGEEARPVLLECRHEFRMHLRVGRGGKIAGNARENDEEQAESGCESQGNIARNAELLCGVLPFQDAVKGIETEHRQGELENHQCH